MTNSNNQSIDAQSDHGPRPGGRGGAPIGNANRTRHGLRACKLPPGCERLGRDLCEVRRALEDATFSIHGEVSAGNALLISAAVDWERHRRLALRWLRIDFDSLSNADRLSFSREAARAATERNKVIESLKLGQKPDDFYNGSLIIPSLPSNADAELIDQSTADAANVASEATATPSGTL